MRGKFVLLTVMAALAAGIAFWHFRDEPRSRDTQAVVPSAGERAGEAVHQPRASAPLPAASTAPPPVGVNRERWQQVFKATRRESLQAIAQRAAVSGKLTDIAALAFMENYCFRFTSGARQYEMMKISLSPEQKQHADNGQVRCARAGTPTSSQIPLRDAEGLDAVAEDLIKAMRGTFLQGDAKNQQLLSAVLASRSVELLDAVSRTLLRPEDAYAAGLAPGVSVNLDHQLLVLATMVRACSARGDCDIVGMDQLQCPETHTCVTDMKDYARQYVFVAPEKRAFMFRHPNVSASEMEVRWNEIQDFLGTLVGP